MPSIEQLTLSPAVGATDSDWEHLDAVAHTVAGCTLCRLHETRTQTVFADGNPQAKVLVIGEGPGQQEDETGIPFVGRAGQLLTSMLQSVGLDRQKDVYIANVVKCRPPQNRKPLPDEMQTCHRYLAAQIRLVNPQLLVLAGATALEGVLGQKQPITKVRGQWLDYQGIPAMPIFHPSYLLRNPSREPQSPKWLTWQDLKAIKARLDEQTAFA